ncbi:hypothetical protein AMJ86_04425 [bacterium SM23_57]|nr:MAG: hypothetical protein AMJ86_04425 [bacterium SM23_57]
MNFNVITPLTTKELLKTITENQDINFRFGAGCTDLLVELKKEPVEGLTVINLTQLTDDHFTSITSTNEGIRIGALATAHRIASNADLRNQFPVLFEAANKHGSRQVRQVATIGGNLCTASPAGDMACALVALEAHCEILSTNESVRTIPIGHFFTDVRKTDLKKDEILRSIVIPPMNGADEDDIITHAGIAIGSAAPTIKFTTSACEYLIGKKLSEIGASESEEFAAKVLEYASPISDIRGSAWYRKQVLFNISKSIFEH